MTAGGADGRTARLSDEDLELLARASAPSVTLLVYAPGGASGADGADGAYAARGPATRSAALSPGRPVVVGRDKPATLLIDDSSLSRRHCLFELRDGEVFVEDLGSTNGTRVNGAAITRQRIDPGDDVLMGSVAATVHARLGSGAGAALALAVGGHDRFFQLLCYEVDRARACQQGAALLMVECSSPASDASGRWIDALGERLRKVDRLGLYAPNIVEVLLPAIDGQAAGELARRLLDAAGATRTALRAALACFPADATSPDGLLDACRAALQRADAAEIARAPSSRHAAPAEADADDDDDGSPLIVSDAMRAVFETVDRVANANIGVLITGETGAGKELVAHALHQRSRRAAAPLCAINCGAIPASLVESALFGHERGAFTGATRDREGVFEAARGGTVFLDEIGELSPGAQAALLRALESKRITRVGATEAVEVDVRVIAATHRDLRAMCESGEFRQDLLYRLDGITIALPALRDRPRDIEPLAERFLRRAARANQRDVRGIEADALRALRRYAWPGNVRELKNAIERAVVITRAEHIDLDDLPERVRLSVRARAVAAVRAPESADELAAAVPSIGELLDAETDFRARVQRYEADLIASALELCGYNQSETSRRLRIPLRTLISKIEQYDLRRR